MDNRKRARSRGDQEEEEEEILTPHTQRLLKLVAEGTDRHAQLAASHLTQIASTASPIVLWDILGRLALMLTKQQQQHQWACRQHASWALHGVAQQLPSIHQTNFLNHVQVEENNKGTHLWLTVHDIVEQISVVLERGRKLYSTSSDSAEFQEDEAELTQLDQSCESENNFLQQRIRLQRHILARRLGLGGIVRAMGKSGQDMLPSNITDKDLGTLNVPPHKKGKASSSTNKSDRKEAVNIRSLLVMEMQYQQQKSASPTASHENPQQLLATELLYRTFDTDWEVRHGALLGIKCLLQAWRQRKSFADGAWPLDILARSLCLLALDRFADYGDSNHMVAPVRQVAGQVVALLYEHVSLQVQHDCRTILATLVAYESEWDVRYGGLVGLQYLVVLEKQVSIIEECMIPMGLQRLSDSSDDVVAATADMLWTIIQQHSTLIKSVLPCMKDLWKALTKVQSVSACAVNLVKLFSALLTSSISDKEKVLDQIPGGAIVEELLRLLEFESSTVKISVLNSISKLAQQEAACLFVDTDVFCTLFLRVLELYWTINDGGFVENGATAQHLTNLRDIAWTNLCDIAPKAVAADSPQRSQLLTNVILRLSGMAVNGDSVRIIHNESPLSIRHDAARAVAQALWKMYPHPSSFLGSAMLELFKSPWSQHCEAACLLYRNICLESDRHLVIDSCASQLHGFLTTRLPVCCLVEKDKTLVLDVPAKESYIKMMRSNLILAWQGKPLIDTKSAGWIESQSAPVTHDNVLSMRILALVSGAVISGGPDQFPDRLTPLIRVLMTSLKSEKEMDRLKLTCRDLVSLLKSLTATDTVHSRNKILSNVLKLLLAGSEGAVDVVEMLVRELPSECTVESLTPLWQNLEPLGVADPSQLETGSYQNVLTLMRVVSNAITKDSIAACHLINFALPALLCTVCNSPDTSCRTAATLCVKQLCVAGPAVALNKCIPLLAQFFDESKLNTIRLGACKLLRVIVAEADMEACPFVRYLLPLAMSLMTDSVVDCAKEASQLFSVLVRLAPLVREAAKVDWSLNIDDHSQPVIDHLIHGKPLPPCPLPDKIAGELANSGISLRSYQLEGVAWLRFLRTVRLNGALCDEMGTGKTLESLVAVALAHHASQPSNPPAKTLVICPASVVGHWVAEIKRFFPSLFTVLNYSGNMACRQSLWEERFPNCNIVVASYSILRTDIKRLKNSMWEYCILDEGHLLKNPKTATAKASKLIQARARLILTGTPVQNRVNELWAAFDFLMPNFLGSSISFSQEYARPIARGQHPGASTDAIEGSMTKLKILHQQVLPFILRRTKEQVLKDLPPKTIAIVPCPLSTEQAALYKSFCCGSEGRNSIAALQQLTKDPPDGEGTKLGKNVLRSLLYLRLLCTHPCLVEKITESKETSQLERSGKLQVLNELLRTAGIVPDELTAADNDASTFYIAANDEDENLDSFEQTLVCDSETGTAKVSNGQERTESKCLIFAQFTQSLNVVEKYLFEAHMPSLRYLRLDGSVPNEKRSGIVDAFNQDDSIKVLLLTTRVGSLGLNLTGADQVIFLEHDYNPFSDLQAMDRAHRIGQSKPVNIYRLVSTETIEEKIMEIQQSKIRVSNAIVNTDNSSMFSMGTDKLLDIFAFQSDGKGVSKKSKASTLEHLDELYDSCEYQSLSVEEFVKTLGK